MKRIVSTFLAFFGLIVCNAQGKPKAQNQSEMAKKYEAIHLAKRQNLVELKTVIPLNVQPADMDQADAMRFVKNYQGAKLSTSIEALHFDKNTVKNFSDLYVSGKIDGLRAYLARYDDGKFTIILVGTKSGDGRHVDQIIKLKGTNLVQSIQNFGDPCPPPACDGNIIGGGN